MKYSKTGPAAESYQKPTLIIPLGSFGSSHWTTTVLELTGLALTFNGGPLGTVIIISAFDNSLDIQFICNRVV